jgi:hypothetical protein
VLSANTAQQVLDMAGGLDLPARVAREALVTIAGVLRDAPVKPDVFVVSRKGEIIGHAG